MQAGRQAHDLWRAGTASQDAARAQQIRSTTDRPQRRTCFRDSTSISPPSRASCKAPENMSTSQKPIHTQDTCSGMRPNQRSTPADSPRAPHMGCGHIPRTDRGNERSLRTRAGTNTDLDAAHRQPPTTARRGQQTATSLCWRPRGAAACRCGGHKPSRAGTASRIRSATTRCARPAGAGARWNHRVARARNGSQRSRVRTR